MGASRPTNRLLIKGRLLSPVAITPSWASGPPGHDLGGCAFSAVAPRWELTNIYYLNQTGDNTSTSIKTQQLRLRITNLALDYDANCVGVLSSDLEPIPTRFSCETDGGDVGSNNRYHIETDVLFEPAGFGITVNQTWYCDDVDPGHP